MSQEETKFLISSSILLLLLQFSTQSDVLNPSQKLKDGDLLVSSNKTFALGFFSPGKSSNRYVGIWYNKVSEQTVVWVANRDNPVNDSSGVFSFDVAGNLVIYGRDRNIPVWSTNISSPGMNYSAQLLDSGNLVVFGGDSKRVVAWQSFDYPTNTLLPTMKLGVNKRTGLKWSMSSWKSRDDPGTGEYLYEIDLTGCPEPFLYKGSARLWRTGPWNGIRFSGVPAMSSNFLFKVGFVDNQDAVYTMYGMNDPSVFSIMVVNESGVLERTTWHEDGRRWVRFWSAPRDQCDYYGHCGEYGNCDPYTGSDKFECSCLPGFEPKSSRDWYLRDGSGGCVRKRVGKVCRAGEGFVKVTGTKIPETTVAVVNENIGLKQCEEECLKNCKCSGYTTANVSGVGGGCINWYGPLVDTREFSSGGQDLFIRVDAVELAQYLKSQRSHGKKGLVAVVVSSVVAALCLITCLCCWVGRKRKGNRDHHKLLFSPNISRPTGTSPRANDFNECGTNVDLPSFDLDTVIAATSKFSLDNKLGQGGFGTVYKGQLHNGQEIAVKRLANNSGQGVEEFKNEVTLIAKLQHRNLVRLLGYCIQKEEKMLIYEYLPNKGLDSYIFDKTKASSLDWRKRLDITLGIARGMVYLHQDSRLRIIHRDLKASNVLLDAAMNPKISDFGMARMFGGDQIEANTNRVVGTYGYMSPEYAMEGLFSVKSDVFSFGVLLLEIISGRKNNSYYQENSVNLIGHIWDLWREGQALDIVDSSLGESYPTKEVLRCIHIGLLCVQEHATDRPTMSDVAFMLCNETALPPPKQPAFIFKKVTGPDSSSTSVGACSINEVTLSVVQAR